MKFLLRLFSAVFGLGIIAGICAVLLVAGAYTLYSRAAGPAEAKTVNIARGTGMNGIIEQLYYEGTICQSSELRFWPVCKGTFIIGTLLTGNRGELKAGEYEIPAGASMAQIVGMMAEGKVVIHKVTVVEGQTVQQVMEMLHAEAALEGPLPLVPPEGSLLPETYFYNRGDTRAEVLVRMAAGKKEALAKAWAKRAPNLPLKTPEEALTLASIVEKETGIAAERAKVAGVFINRLRINMPLQSDPTVIYAVSKGFGQLDRQLYTKDLAFDSPYNTYANRGLPPGPIANPGLASIEAVLQPESHDYLYFVADGTGGHAFGKTLAEHNKNVAKWRALNR